MPYSGRRRRPRGLTRVGAKSRGYRGYMELLCSIVAAVGSNWGVLMRGFQVLAAALMLAAGWAAGLSEANAGFKVCNKAEEGINVAIGYQSRDYGWTAEGWWTVPEDSCTSILNGDLDQRYIYIYAIGTDGGLWAAEKGEQEGGFFCLRTSKFTFHNNDYQKNNEIDCEASGETTKQFVVVDTKGATDFTYDLEQ